MATYINQGIASVKKYNDSYYRVTVLKCSMPNEYTGGTNNRTKSITVHTKKLEASISRTKSRIFELAVCNEWSYFVTLTLNKKIRNRYDIRTFKEKLSKWLNNYNRLHNIHIRYLLIPEEHKDGAWHMHGLMTNIPQSDLKILSLSQKLPYKLRVRLLSGHVIYDWPSYTNKFGFITLESVYNNEAVAKYITKYISKQLEYTSIPVNAHLYYSSQGLKRSEIMHEGELTKPLVPDFENDYIAIKVVKTMDDALSYFGD